MSQISVHHVRVASTWGAVCVNFVNSVIFRNITINVSMYIYKCQAIFINVKRYLEMSNNRHL